MEELVSVIIPVYNVAGYIKDCLNSIRKQSYANLEIILVDDGATDESGAICDEYALLDERIKVVHKQNGGLSDARNCGIDIAHGDYLMFVDSDDFVDERIVEILYHNIKEQEAEIAICDPVHVFQPEDAVFAISDDVKIYSREEAVCTMWYQKAFLPSAWAKLYKASLFQDIRFRVGILYEDIDVMHEIFWRTDRIAYTPSQLYAYQHREGSITTNKFSLRDCEILNICDRLKSFAKDKSVAVQEAARAYGVVGALRVELNAPEQEEFIPARNSAREILKADAYAVLRNRQIRIKSRIGLCMYLWCRPLMKLVYGKINRWK